MSATARSTLESLIRTMTPDEAARTAAARHREEIEDWLRSDLEIVCMRETGSWHHGTALDGFSDVDYFVTMRGIRPTASSAALETLRSSLARGVQGAFVSVDRPAVRLRYFDGGPDVEMRTAQYALGHTPIIYDWDLRDFFKSLSSSGLREMNDPTNYGRRVATGANGLTDAITAKYAVDEAARLAALAREATEADDHASAIGHLVRLFNVQS